MKKGVKMRKVKCRDCEEYRNEWCEKVIDSPHPDMLRDCQYFHEKDKDLIKVIRCRDCKFWDGEWCYMSQSYVRADDYCSNAMKEGGN